jgi:hypothetical protein
MHLDAIRLIAGGYNGNYTGHDYGGREEAGARVHAR